MVLCVQVVNDDEGLRIRIIRSTANRLRVLRGGAGVPCAKASEGASPPGLAAVWEKHRRQVNSLRSAEHEW